MNRKNAASFYFILASTVLLFCAVLFSGCTGYSGQESFVLDAGNYTFYEFEMFEGNNSMLLSLQVSLL